MSFRTLKTCHHCGATYSLEAMRAHATYRVEPDLAGPDAVLLEAIDCLCKPYGRSTLVVELHPTMVAA